MCRSRRPLEQKICGRSLFLITDHPPNVGSVSSLLSLLGFQPFDGYVGPSPDAPSGVAVYGPLDEGGLAQFTRLYGIDHDRYRRSLGEPGRLGQHAILEGRSSAEAVTSVVTFTGTAFFPSRGVEPLLTFGPQATGMAAIPLNLPDAKVEEYAMTDMTGAWIQAGVRSFGAGRVAVLGEAAMCSAQWAGQQRVTMGMNAPFASQNARFCLNVVGWLSGLFD
ncbi:MAG: hypothetical protein Q8P50_03735 [Bacillota bacterium]|nr:hypothetical protein [Bacillota bacterium]